MAELASLQITVDTRQAKQAATDLDKVAASAKQTEAATKAFGSSGAKAFREASAANDNLKRGFGETSDRAERLASRLDATSTSLWAVAGSAGGAGAGLSTVVDGLDSASSLLYAGKGAGVIAGFAAVALALAGLGIGAMAAQKQLVELNKAMEDTAQSANTIRGLEILGAGAGLGKGAATKSLEEFRDAVRSYRKDEGDLKDALEEVNKKYLTRIDNAQGVKGAFKGIVEILREVNRADAEKIAEAAFGEDNAEKMLRLIREQGKGYADIEAAAAAAGVAVDDGLVRATAQTKLELDAANDIANTKLKAAFEGLIPSINKIYEIWINIKTLVADLAPYINKIAEGAANIINAIGRSAGNANTESMIKYGGVDIPRPPQFPQYPDEASRRRAGLGIEMGRDQRSGRTPDKKSGGGSTADETDKYEELVKATQQRIKALEMEEAALHMTADAARLYKLEQGLLLDAEKKGIELSPEKIEALKGYAAQLAETQKRIDDMKKAQEASDKLAKDMSSGFKSFISDFRSGMEQGKNAWQAFADAGQKAIDRILNKFIEAQLNDIFKQLFSGGGGSGGFGGFLSGLFGGGGGTVGGVTQLFASGGYISGPGSSTSDSIPARLSNGEYVINARATRQNRQLLDAINYGFAEGGYVGQGAPSMGSSSAPVVQIITSQRVDREERGRTPDGRELRKIVLSDVKNDMGKGGFDGALGGRFSAQPSLVSRG